MYKTLSKCRQFNHKYDRNCPCLNWALTVTDWRPITCIRQRKKQTYTKQTLTDLNTASYGGEGGRFFGEAEGKRWLRWSRRWWEVLINMIFKKGDEGSGQDWSGSGQSQGTCCCENGNEYSVCTKWEENSVLSAQPAYRSTLRSVKLIDYLTGDNQV